MYFKYYFEKVFLTTLRIVCCVGYLKIRSNSIALLDSTETRKNNISFFDPNLAFSQLHGQPFRLDSYCFESMVVGVHVSVMDPA